MKAAGPATRDFPLAHTDSGASVRDWIYALSRRHCSNTEFLRHVREQGREDSDVLWEALALLDQAFRSRRIDRETFLQIKSDLQHFALRGSGGIATAPEAAAPERAATPEATSPEPLPPPAPVTTEPVQPAALGIGSLLRGRYRVIGILGKGAKGTLVEAIDELRADTPGNTQRIAIRVFESLEMKQSGRVSAYLAHVCRLQALSHPNLLRVFDFDQDQGRPFLSMELLSGYQLSRFISPTDAPPRYRLDRLNVLACVAGALQHAHAHGLAHGELRPEEVFITHSGDVRLLGLDGAIDRTTGDFAKDHLAFAWLVRDLLTGGTQPELRRPEGLKYKQWRTLKAVILGDTTRGPLLLQLFAPPGATKVAIGTVRGARSRWLRGLLIMGLAGGAGFAIHDRIDLQSYFIAEPAAVDSTPVQFAASSPKASPSSRRSAAGSAKPAAEAAPSPAAVAAPAAPTSRYSSINLARRSIQVEDSQTVARVVVLRQGNLGRSATFVWWTEAGTAEPGTDFYGITPRGAQFAANSSAIELFVPLVPNARHDQPVTFYVKIDEASAGTSLGERTLAQVSIVPQAGVLPR